MLKILILPTLGQSPNFTLRQVKSRSGLFSDKTRPPEMSLMTS